MDGGHHGNRILRAGGKDRRSKVWAAVPHRKSRRALRRRLPLATAGPAMLRFCRIPRQSCRDIVNAPLTVQGASHRVVRFASPVKGETIVCPAPGHEISMGCISMLAQESLPPAIDEEA